MKGCRKIFTLSQQAEFGFYHFTDQFFGRKRLYKLLSNRRQKFNNRILETLTTEGPGRVLQIERRKNLSLTEFKHHYRRKGIPVVLEGAANNWDCVKNWTLDYFEKLHGNDVIAHTDHKLESVYETITLRDIINGIKSGGSKYYRFYPLLNRHPEHIKDFDYKWLLERKNKRIWFETWQVFIGSKNTISTLHIENQCNLFVQVCGEKKWAIYPGSYSAALNPAPARTVYRSPGVKIGKNMFDVFNPDDETYPQYKYLDRLETTLKPGDVLFNPCFTWHTAQNSTNSISVGYRWVAPLYAFKINPLFMLMDMIARNPTIWKAFKLYAEDTNLIRISESGNLEKYLQEKAEKEKLLNTPSAV